ncbi:MAG: permease [Candidatus Omnitrophota bacterium]|nr:permease [Candidatus Omnitrophota bacterium]
MASDHDKSNHEEACCRHDRGPAQVWYKTGLFWTAAVAVLLLALSFFLPFLHKYRQSFLEYTNLLLWPVAFGFLLGGMLDHFVPKTYISKHLASGKKRSVFYAVGLGLAMSACSHGILALSMELHKKGASGAAVVSFLLASPWANLPVTILLIGLFGLSGILICVTAAVIAVVTGLIFLVLDRYHLIEHNRHHEEVDEGFSVRRDIARRIKEYQFSGKSLAADLRGIAKGAWGLVDMVLWWILIGVILASFSGAYISPDIFQRFLGPSILGLFMTMVIATVLEVCSEGTAPLAFEIYRQTGALGNSFAFLMGGVVTDYTEIGLLWANVGKKTALWMVAITLPQVILMAIVYNLFF